jgi:hypothetical protein
MKQMDNSDFTIVEKMTVLYYGLHVAKEIFFSATEIAFFEGMITSGQKNEWEHFFEHEFILCRKIDIQTYHGRSWLEFKVRHLMDLAMNISFGENPAWKGHSASFENVFFPLLSGIG